MAWDVTHWLYFTHHAQCECDACSAGVASTDKCCRRARTLRPPFGQGGSINVIRSAIENSKHSERASVVMVVMVVVVVTVCAGGGANQ